MASVIAKYFKKTSTDIVYIGEELELLLPYNYFEIGYAERIGDHYNTYGVMEARCKNGNKIEKGTLAVPSMINVYPKSTYETKDELDNKIIVLKFFKNDKVTDNAVIASLDNAKLMVQQICSGKTPESIPYDKLLDQWYQNLNLNDKKYNVGSTIKELIIADLCVSKKDPSIKFAKEAGTNPNYDKNGYKPTSINVVCANSSTFSAVTFENIDEMLITSINKKRYNKKQKESPLEKILKL